MSSQPQRRGGGDCAVFVAAGSQNVCRAVVNLGWEGPSPTRVT